MPPMDFYYSRFLRAYIEHVGKQEWTDFLRWTDFLGRCADDGIEGLTQDDVNELKRLSDLPFNPNKEDQ